MKRFAQVVGLISAFLLPAAALAQDDEAQWKAAQAHLAKVKIPLAGTVERFDCPRAAKTDDFCLFLYAAYARQADDDHVGAIEYAVAALQEKPRSLRALTLVGDNVEELAGGCDAALPYLEVVAVLQNERGISSYLYCLTRDAGSGWAQHSRAVRIAELSARYFQDPWYWWAAAKVHYNGQRYTAARHHAANLAASDPESSETWYLHSHIMRDLDELDAAAESAIKAVQLRRKVSDEEARRRGVRTLERHYRNLIERLWDAGRFEEALQHARALAKSPDRETTAYAKRQIEGLTYQIQGADSVSDVAIDLDAENASHRVELDFFRHLAEKRTASFPAEQIPYLDTWNELRRLILNDDLEAAEKLASHQLDKSVAILEVLDFRGRQCSSLGDAHNTWVTARRDNADAWKDAMVGDAWQNFCNETQYSGIRPGRSARPEEGERLKAIDRATFLFVGKDFLGAVAAVENLPDLNEPVYHEFRALLAAGAGDEVEFRKWEKLAARGSAYIHSLPLARMLFHLRRKEAAEARAVWASARPRWRERPLLFPLVTAYLGFVVVEEASEVDPTLARELADVWFQANNGVLEERVREMLKTEPAPSKQRDKP